MEYAWRPAQSRGRMDSSRNGGICRRFLNGSCRFGSRCNYRHELPVIPSSQICRYFQKGGCWYGERCRYLHVLQPEVVTAVANRRGSVSTVSSSSSVAHTPPDRRGSEPAHLQDVEISTQEFRRTFSRSELIVNITNPQHDGEHQPENTAEEQPQETELALVQSSEAAQAVASHGRNNEEASSSEAPQDGAAAATSSTQGKVEEMEAFLQSKSMTCGICMDKVYEKADPRDHVFGILPNCNHSFCLQCIMTWRKTKDLGVDVIKTCPQCRVRSAFYVPNKYWVEGQAKESLIAAFKKKFRKKSCSYYQRYGCCPFKTECLYRHDKLAFPYLTEGEDDDDLDLLNFYIALTLLSGDDSDDDDDFDIAFYLADD